MDFDYHFVCMFLKWFPLAQKAKIWHINRNIIFGIWNKIGPWNFSETGTFFSNNLSNLYIIFLLIWNCIIYFYSVTDLIFISTTLFLYYFFIYLYISLLPYLVLGQVATPQVATVEIASGYFGSGLLDLSNGGGYCGCGYSVSVNSQPH